jgi:hypothetical protein
MVETRSGSTCPECLFIDDFFIFFHVEENEAKEDARVPLTLRVVQPADDAAPRAAVRRCQANSGAHNLKIAARLALPDALPGSTMLAPSTD